MPFPNHSEPRFVPVLSGTGDSLAVNSLKSEPKLSSTTFLVDLKNREIIRRLPDSKKGNLDKK
jgi:hypothetical protein